MKGGMHNIWKRASQHSHAPAATYKTERKVREFVGPPKPAALAEKIPVILNEEGKIVHPRVWTIIHTGPRQEMAAVAQLKRDGYAAYCPVITKWQRTGSVRRIQHVPLFPRYVFAAVKEGATKSLNACLWGKPIALDSGAIPFFGGQIVYAISDEQAAGVFDEAKSDAERFAAHEALKAARKAAYNRVQEGDSVLIDDELWGEIDATVLRKSSETRVILLMNILGSATKITVPLDRIRPAA